MSVLTTILFPSADRREANRLSDADRADIRAGVRLALRERHHAERYSYAPGALCVCGRAAGHAPSIAEDFNAMQRPALRSIGCDWRSMRQSEMDEVADIIAAVILDASL